MRSFWYYEKSADGNYHILDQESSLIDVAPNEAAAFQIVREHNCDLLSQFEKAKQNGRAPSAP